MDYLLALKRLHALGHCKFVGGHREKLHGTDVWTFVNACVGFGNNQEMSV